jgi:hypothetical protein
MKIIRVIKLKRISGYVLNMRMKRTAHRILAGKSKHNRPFRRPRHNIEKLR